eukprot:TRINITY_DN2461_c0_g1_i11.p1 TRINITY_DN2461_c0_g1~~TRINITY_DN2461_c0_g1_i11.p1  ORF type:complete len:128 (-),score=35.42 TRINITY_DN2461_c0_g1_i11:192-575(-)
MNAIHETYPIQPNYIFLKKIAKNMIPLIGLNSTFANRWGRFFLTTFGIEYKERFVAMLRGFPQNEDFLCKFRKQSSTALLAMLLLKMSTFEAESFKRKTAELIDAQSVLLKNGIQVPGHLNEDRVFW